MLLRYLYLSVLLCAASIIARADDGTAVDPERFAREIVVGDLMQPMEIDRLPDGSLLLIELAGKLRLIDTDAKTINDAGKLDVTTAQENGLIGLAIDPNFADNHFIYLQYSPPDFPGQRVSRFEFRDSLLPQSEKILLSYEEQRQECCHHAGSMEFDAHGNLYIGTGDNTNPFNDSDGFAPLDERPGRAAWDSQRTAGNSRSFNGKILRIHPEADGTYSIPEGNLFDSSAKQGLPEIYVMGCRNPWRISIDPKTEYLYWGDVGPDASKDTDRGPRGHDEINQARQAGNFGWPYFNANNKPYADFDFATRQIGSLFDPEHPVNNSPNSTGVHELPPAQPAMIFYPGAASAEFPELASGGRTACAGPVFYASQSSAVGFPAAYNHNLFAFEWSRNAVYAIALDDQDHVKHIENFLPKFNLSRPIDLLFDAEGRLLVLEYGETWGVNPDARLVRFSYQRGNRKPVAVAKVDQSVGREPLAIKLSANDSSDKDGDTLQYHWSIVGQDVSERKDLGHASDAAVTISQIGVYTVELEVSDSAGASSQTSLPIIVGNSRPTVRFIEPQDGDFFDSGATIRYKLTIDDFEDGTSDEDLADEQDREFIDAMAPTRTFVELGQTQDDLRANEPPGLTLIRTSDCFQCHATSRPLVGPSFLDVANKYRDKPEEFERSVVRVTQGSTGVWGKVAMLPHAQFTADQVRSMVKYVYDFKAADSVPSVQGLVGELPVPKDAATVQLIANYADLGRGSIPALTGTSSIHLRKRLIEAEAAASFSGAAKLGGHRSSGNAFMGSIEHKAFLAFDNIPLADVGSIKLRVASAGAGGRIEIHRNSTTGPLLGSTDVEVNGDWEGWYTREVVMPELTGHDSLYLVFLNEKQQGGLMNLDSVEFTKR